MKAHAASHRVGVFEFDCVSDGVSLLALLLRPPSSPSQRCKVYTQKGVMPATPSLSSLTLAQDSQAPEALTSDSKTSVSIQIWISSFSSLG